MQNKKLKNKELGKMEFLIPIADKIRFRELCQRKSYGMAEILKRGFEDQLSLLEMQSRKDRDHE
jgi:hypothetical protein